MPHSRLLYQRQWRAKNPGKSAIYTKKWRDTNKEQSLAASRAQAAKDCIKSKAEIIKAYGSKCVCCGENRSEFLTIDHQIEGDGVAHRKKFRTSHKMRLDLKRRGYPKDGYRLLCFNCNCAIGSFGYCPHERERHASVYKVLPKVNGSRVEKKINTCRNKKGKST